MTDKILVTGASGQVGGFVLQGLRARGLAPRGLSRSPVKLDGQDWKVGDFENTGSLIDALQGITLVFLASGDHPEQDRLESAMIDACRQTGVRHIVKLSAQSAALSPPASFGALHWRIEQTLKTSAIAYTILRPVFFMQSIGFFADDIRKGRLIAPTGKGAVALIDARDVADAALAVLTQPDKHHNKIYELTGPRAWRFDEVGALISMASNTPVRHISPPAWLAKMALPFVSGMPRWQSNLAVALMHAIANGAQREPSPDFALLCGKEPRSLEQWLVENEPLFTK